MVPMITYKQEEYDMIGLKSIGKKGMGIILSAVMIASMMPVQALAGETINPNSEQKDIGDQTGEVEVTTAIIYPNVENYDVTATVGKITPAEGSNRGSMRVDAWEGKTADVTAESVTNDDEGSFVVSVDNGTVGENSSVPGGTAKVTINKDINSRGVGINTETYRGNTTINVKGSVTGDFDIEEEEFEGYAIMALVCGDGTLGIDIGGDVSSLNGSGIVADSCCKVDYVGDPSDDRSVKVTVNGTVKSNKIGVMLSGNEEGRKNITITAWKIETNKIAGNDAVAAYTDYDDDGKLKQDENFEKNNINYIIKLEQPAEGNAFKAIDGNNKTVNNGDTRKEDTEIMLEALPGFEITGAFNGKGEKVPLEYKDGHYFIKVPKGGGVYLSVTVGSAAKTKILNPQPTNGESSNNNTENSASLCASIAQMILNAAPGETVTVFIPTGTSLCKKAVDALEARKDVTLVVNYGFNNGIYSATIPANTDLTQYKNAVGGIDFETLTANFNGRQIY